MLINHPPTSLVSIDCEELGLTDCCSNPNCRVRFPPPDLAILLWIRVCCKHFHQVLELNRNDWLELAGKYQVKREPKIEFKRKTNLGKALEDLRKLGIDTDSILQSYKMKGK